MAESGKQIISGVMDWSVAAAMALQLCRRSEWYRWHGKDSEPPSLVSTLLPLTHPEYQCGQFSKEVNNAASD